MAEAEALKIYFDFLEELRESGQTNMFGARPYLQAVFPDLSDNQAKMILVKWMESYRINKGRVIN
jgi:hypothetical protein